jgi:hypothetical protein
VVSSFPLKGIIEKRDAPPLFRVLAEVLTKQGYRFIL